MADGKERTHSSTRLPDFLRVTVDKGIIDASTARRIELHRITRGLGNRVIESAIVGQPPNPALTFESFMIYRGNSFAAELARSVSRDSAAHSPYNPLYIYAEVGLGKTHLLSAIANEASDKSVILVNTSDLEVELERALRLGIRAELREWIVSHDVLLLDDIQLCEGNENLQREVFSLFNHMIRARRWVVITSDVPPTGLQDVETRLLSRLSGGIIVSLQMGDRAERRRFVERFLGDHPASDEVVEYVADNVSENVRQLRAAVLQLLAAVGEPGTMVSLDVARDVVAGPKQRVISQPHVPPAPVIPQPRPQPPPPPASYPDPVPGVSSSQQRQSVADRFKEMLAGAESKEEQILALQIALSERVRQLRKEGGDPSTIEKLDHALDLLREGKMEEVIQRIST